MRFALALAFVFLASPACFAQESWFPAKEGATWVYDRTSRTDAAGVGVVTGTNVITGTCRGKEKVDGEACWLLEWKESDADDSGSYHFTGKMWVRGNVETLVVSKTTNEAWLPPADFKGKKSRVTVHAKGADVVCESTVGDEEDVKTPAGKFKAVKVQNEVTTAGVVKMKETGWFARGVGLVKLTRVVETAGSKVTDDLVLKKFTKGKDAEPEKKPDEKAEDSAKGDDKDAYLPAKDGRTWTYRHQSRAEVAGVATVTEKETVTCTVKGKEKIGDLDCWLLEWSGGAESKFNGKVWVRSDSSSVTVARSQDRNLWVLPGDGKKKKESVKVRSGNDEVSVESSVGDEEEVETPAGKFKAVKVQGEVLAAGTSVKRTAWYAKGVGLVKVSKDVEAGGAVVHDELVLTKRGD